MTTGPTYPEVSPRIGPRRITSAALLVAVTYSAALVMAGFLVPVYSTDSASSDGEVLVGSATLVADNGAGVIVVLAIPLLISAVVGALLFLLPRRGTLTTAWLLTGLLAAFNLLAMLSIGIFVVPVTAALVVACATSSRQPAR